MSLLAYKKDVIGDLLKKEKKKKEPQSGLKAVALLVQISSSCGGGRVAVQAGNESKKKDYYGKLRSY